MENASKALIIAGAILISILLIAISMYIYQSATGAVQTAASKMSQSDKNAYNATVKNYSSKGTLNGSDVISMIDEITTQNSQYVDESGKFISINAESISGYSSADKNALNDATKAANVYEDADGTNTQTNINAAKNEYTKLKKKISSGKKYEITETEKDGIIYLVTITEK